MSAGQEVVLRPIDDDDVDQVGGFLHRELNGRVPADAWARGLRARWVPEAPNHGFMLLEHGDVVGANVAFYSRREIGGRVEPFCNVGALCVVQNRRSHAIRLVRAILRQQGYTFTDLSPSGNVVELNRRLGFQNLDTDTFMQINGPLPLGPPVRTITDPAEIESMLDGRALQVFHDHRHSPAALHVLLADGPDFCYVIARKDRRKRLPLFVSVLYVSDQELFQRAARAVGRHFLLHAGAPFTLLEPRVTGQPPVGSIWMGRPRPKMYKSSRLGPEDVDYLYSELTQIAW